MTKRLGVIGYGWMGQLLGRVAGELPNVNLAAIADPAGYIERNAVGLRLFRSPEDLGATLYTDYTEMLDTESLDAVIIATPEPMHVDPVLAAVEAGCHVFLEKPIARTLDEADRIIAACKEAGRKLMIGYILRFEPAYLAIRDAVRSGKIGTFKAAYARRNGTIDEARRLAGRTSVTNYIAVHDIDQILSYHPGVPVRSVFAKAVRGRVQEELGTWDFSWAMFEFEDGSLGVVETGWGLPENSWGDSKMHVIGTRGQYELNLVPMNVMGVNPDGWTFPITRLWSDIEGRLTGAVQTEIAHFVECLETNREPCVRGEDGRRSLELAIGIERSIETGEEIRLPLQ